MNTETRKFIEKTITCTWGERKQVLATLELFGYTIESSDIVTGEEYDLVIVARREIERGAND